ncbi:MAG TPA: hypothetical protein VHM64_17260 [Candidatus Binatia bacterium]|nr:hypothetical protein [Candidatus Binatia bacterium]
MKTDRKQEQESTRLNTRLNTRLKWIFGTTYAVQGSSAFTDIPSLYFVKFALEMGDAGGQLFQSLKSLGWLVKPLWGFISDRIPLFGYHRKSWFILMAVLGVVFWIMNALLALNGIRIPSVYLIGFNLAFSTYAFVDVVADALMVEHGRRLKRVGSFVNFQWTMLSIANAIATALSGWLQQKIVAGEFEYWAIFLFTGIPPLFTAVIGYLKIPERPVPPASPRATRRLIVSRVADVAQKKEQASDKTDGEGIFDFVSERICRICLDGNLYGGCHYLLCLDIVGSSRAVVPGPAISLADRLCRPYAGVDSA